MTDKKVAGRGRPKNTPERAERKRELFSKILKELETKKKVSTN